MIEEVVEHFLIEGLIFVVEKVQWLLAELFLRQDLLKMSGDGRLQAK